VPQSLRNVIERMKVEQGLYVAQQRAEITLNSIGDAVVSTDMHGCVDYLNVAAELITGWSREEARGRPIAEVLDHRRQRYRDDRSTILSTTSCKAIAALGLTGDTVLVDRHGKRMPDRRLGRAHPRLGREARRRRDGVPGHLRNVALTSKMRHLAHHDFLTNLPNRVF
jgi:PAS domain S-box-containing protein